MSPKRLTERPKDVIRRLIGDGWVERPGKGDHRNFTKAHSGVVTGLFAASTELPAGNGEAAVPVPGEGEGGWQ